MDLEIKETRNGRGIVAARDFIPEETLYEVTGEFITGDADEAIDEATRNNAFRYSEDLYISPGGTIGDFQNHSCEPNAKVVKRGNRLFVIAAISIRKEEEVLIDYSTILGEDDTWEMECNCASAACRHLIRSFDTLPTETQNTYIERGMVPEYIL